MIIFENEQNKLKFDEKIKLLIEKAIQRTMEYENFKHPYEISVLITDNEGIKSINNQYRNIDRETDVLSFPMIDFNSDYDPLEDIESDIEYINPDSGDIVLGDIVISFEKALSQSIEYGHSLEREISFLTVHSSLHLLGYDHERDFEAITMRSKEEDILKSLDMTR